MRPVRSAAKALIIRDGHLLATKNFYQGEEYYLLPGGGQEFGEPLDDTVRRECREEIGCEVEIHDLIMVSEFIGANHENAMDPSAHQVNLIFQCSISPEATPRSGPSVDAWQIGIEWLPLLRLHEFHLYPTVLRSLLQDSTDASRTYLGDVN